MQLLHAILILFLYSISGSKKISTLEYTTILSLATTYVLLFLNDKMGLSENINNSNTNYHT